MSRFIALTRQGGGRIALSVESIESWAEMQVNGHGYGCTVISAGKPFNVEESWDRIEELIKEKPSDPLS